MTEEKTKVEKLLEEREEKRAKEGKMTVMLVEEQDRSVNLGIVGVGQCGSKIAEEFHAKGYASVVINTAIQDLKHIKIPESKKMLLDYSLGGAAKILENGEEAAQQYIPEILEHIDSNTQGCEVLLLCVGGGGGTGSGSAETMVNVLAKIGKPVVCLYVLPMNSEDTLAKHNSIQTLAKLAKLASDDVINSLIIVDNAKIELLYGGLSMAEFWKTANKAIVDPLHLFNQLSSQPSEFVSLDPMDFMNVWLSGDCSLYGNIELSAEELQDEDAIAEAMIVSLEGGLLSDHFDLSQTRSAGIIITGSRSVLESIPSVSLEYGFSMVNKICNEGTRVFRGVYEVPGDEDTLRIYSFFGGLGLPEERVTELKLEAERHMEALNKKEGDRATGMKIDMGKTSTTSSVDKLHNRIKNKNSPLSKLKKNMATGTGPSGGGKVVDRRRR